MKMTAEVECNALNAKIDSLGKLLDEREERTKDRFTAMEKAVTTAFVQAEKAIEKADTSNQRHFAQVNEFRASLEDQTRKYLEKSVYDVQHSSLGYRIDALQDRLNLLEQRIIANAAAATAQTRIAQWIAGTIIALAAPSVAFVIYFLERR